MIPTIETFITDITNKFVLTGSTTNKGINGFVFDVQAHDEVTAEAEATDHYVEANYSVQDHIALRPMMITLKGFIGELKDTSINDGLAALTSVQSLGDIGGLAPNFAQQAAEAYSAVESVVSQIDSYINQANNISRLFDDKSTANTKQKLAFDKLQSFQAERILCNVSTPFGIFQDMMIVRLSALQREDTNLISDFTVTLKQIRKAETITGPIKVASGRAADAVAKTVQKGQVVGKKAIMADLFPLTFAGR